MQNKSFEIKGSNGLPITLDITFKKEDKPKPIVIFCHGFKGFKDWGAWHLVADKFAKNDYIFLKFNFSHNGTSPKCLTNFDNIKAFSENNYTKELFDLQKIINWTFSKEFPLQNLTKDRFLIGHSRGAGAVLVKQYEEDRILNTCTWAAIDSYNRFGTKEQINNWKKVGEHVFVNGRTGQKMPIKYQFYSDFAENIERLDIQKAVSLSTKPLLVIHGEEDPAVLFESAKNIVSWSKNAQLLAIEKANHVFGSKHPFSSTTLPEELNTVVEETIKFFSTYKND